VENILSIKKIKGLILNFVIIDSYFFGSINFYYIF